MSHGGIAAAELCSRVIWLHEGRLILDGPYMETIAAYRSFMQSSDRSSLPNAVSGKAAEALVLRAVNQVGGPVTNLWVSTAAASTISRI